MPSGREFLNIKSTVVLFKILDPSNLPEFNKHLSNLRKSFAELFRAPPPEYVVILSGILLCNS